MAAITITGTLTAVTPKRMTDPDYNYMGKYSPNTERYLHYLNCCLTTPDGRRFFFDSPKVLQRVTCCPGAALVSFDVEKEGANWFAEVGAENSIARAGEPNTNRLEPLVKAGDTITIRASVKAEKPTYVGLNRVRMVK